MKDLLKKFYKYINSMQPTQIMVGGFATLIFVGAIILSLPISSKNGESVGFINALFTATSAVCVTGLIVVDTATYWSSFGQLIILLLIQIGGLGFMTVTTLFAMIMKKRINLKERLLIQESLNQLDLSGLVKLTRHILLMTFTIEGIGIILLSLVFMPQFGFIKGLWYSVFHSVSAFCNAGFDLMGSFSGKFSSLTYYVDNFIVIITISLLIICGGLGFPVILDLIKKKKFKRLGVHSKVVLTTTAALIVIGTVYIFLAEYNNYETLGNLSLGAKFLAALFQSVTARTAGFNSIELSLMSQAAIFIMIILMFIGASPASTGGGIKTTTLATIIITVKSFLSGKADIEIYERRIGDITLKKSIGIFVIAIGLIIFGTLTISLLEPNYTLLECAFEVVSALTTAGLSIIGSLNLSLPSKLIIMSYMFVGRVGSLTIFMAIIYRGNKKRQLIKYPEGKIIVG